MKRCCIVLVIALLAVLLGGCRFAVVETDEIQVGALFSALAEETLIGMGSRDEKGATRVRDLQERLAALGYLRKADGIFGRNTESALLAFQRESGLEPTGVLDAQTEAALFMNAATLEEAAEATYAALDNTNGGIAALQERLKLYGFYTGEADGEYSEQLRAAIAAFQRYAVACYGTDFDVPPEAEPALAESLPLGASPTPAPGDSLPDMPVLTPAPTVRPYYPVDGVATQALYYYLVSDRFPVCRETVGEEDAGAEVLRVQRRLAAAGYYLDSPDGTFGELTVEAVKAFQQRNGLSQTGIADEATQRRLFSDGVTPLEDVDKPYYIKVSIDDQRVYVYRWLDGDYSFLIKRMVCSTGIGNSTPKGTFVSAGRRSSRWHHFEDFDCWAQYAFVIEGSILFHSVLYSQADESTLRVNSVKALGTKASHGCVRLSVADAKWIYESCTKGQVIEIY